MQYFYKILDMRIPAVALVDKILVINKVDILSFLEFFRGLISNYAQFAISYVSIIIWFLIYKTKLLH